MADCISTVFPQFPRALVQMRYSIGEYGCGHILKEGNSGGTKVNEKRDKREERERKGKAEGRGKRREGKKGMGVCIGNESK